MRWGLLLCVAAFLSACANQDDEAKKSGVCIHATTATPKGAGCGACVAGSPTCDTKIYTYCTDEKKTDDCKNASATCNAAGPAFAIYDDVITYYDGNKKCNTSGYTLTCPGNSKYFVADTAFCPP